MRASDVQLRMKVRTVDVPAAPVDQVSIEVFTGPELRLVDEFGVAHAVGSGGSLEVDDGTVDVTPVTKINVPAGTLTDDGGGEVTLTATGVVVSDDTPLEEASTGDPGVSPDASRSDHIHPEHAGGSGPGGMPLDSYAIDGTYGDDFTTASLSGAWTRRGFSSGDETYQVGKNQTYIRIAMAAAIGDGYFRTAPAGDWIIGMAYIPRFFPNVPAAWGVTVVDTNGTGVATIIYQSSPSAPLITDVTTYSTYGGNYYEVGTGSAASPNIQTMTPNDDHDRKVWTYLRKDGTDYYTAFSLDGEAWSPEAGPLSWAGTVDRIGMLMHPLGQQNPGGAESCVDVDWFNKIA